MPITFFVDVSRDVSPDDALEDDRSLVLGESATSHEFAQPRHVQVTDGNAKQF
jgi:hypothetical protein